MELLSPMGGDLKIDFDIDNVTEPGPNAGFFGLSAVGQDDGDMFAAPEPLRIRTISYDALPNLEGPNTDSAPSAAIGAPYPAEKASPSAVPLAPTPPPSSAAKSGYSHRMLFTTRSQEEPPRAVPKAEYNSNESSGSMAGAAGVAMLRLRRLGGR